MPSSDSSLKPRKILLENFSVIVFFILDLDADLEVTGDVFVGVCVLVCVCDCASSSGRMVLNAGGVTSS